MITRFALPNSYNLIRKKFIGQIEQYDAYITEDTPLTAWAILATQESYDTDEIPEVRLVRSSPGTSYRFKDSQRNRFFGQLSIGVKLKLVALLDKFHCGELDAELGGVVTHGDALERLEA